MKPLLLLIFLSSCSPKIITYDGASRIITKRTYHKEVNTYQFLINNKWKTILTSETKFYRVPEEQDKMYEQ